MILVSRMNACAVRPADLTHIFTLMFHTLVSQFEIIVQLARV